MRESLGGLTLATSIRFFATFAGTGKMLIVGVRAGAPATVVIDPASARRTDLDASTPKGPL